MGWRSQEQSYNFERRNPVVDKEDSAPEEIRERGRRSRREYGDASMPEGLPDRFFDENGEVNLSKVKGKDALQYMSAIGIRIPMGGVNRG